MAGCAQCRLPKSGADYEHWKCACGRQWIFYRMWLPKVGSGGPCADPACSYVGMRMVCNDCPKGEMSDAHCRCEPCSVAHKRNVHGKEPAELTCLCCGSALGTTAPRRSMAGGPMCESCPSPSHGGGSYDTRSATPGTPTGTGEGP